MRHSLQRYLGEPATAFLYGIPALVIFLVYLPTMQNGLVWDDLEAFRNSARYQDFTHLWKAFTEPLVFSDNYYRPLVSASFTIQNALVGVSPKALHLVSLLLHIINSLLVIRLATLLVNAWGNRERVYAPMFAGLLYALHPSLIEPVVFASSRFDLMVTLFTLLLMLATMIRGRVYTRAILSGLLFLLAALSKEMVLGFALALPLWLMVSASDQTGTLRDRLRRVVDKPNMLLLFAIIAGGLIYLLTRKQALGVILPADMQLGSVLTVSEKLILVIRSAGEYLSLIFMPFGKINPSHPIEIPITLASPRNQLSLIFVVAYLLASLLLYKRTPRVSLFLLAGLIVLIPVLGIAPLGRPVDLYFGESYLALPLVFFSLMTIPASQSLLEFVSIRNSRLAPVLYTLGALWFVLSLLTIVTTVPLWKNNLTLWSWATSKHPELIAPRINLASAYLYAGDSASALQLVDQSIRQKTNNPVAWNLKGRILDDTGKYKEAVDAYSRAVALLPERLDYWIELSIALTHAGSLEPARDILLGQVLSRDPDNWVANAHLGFVLNDLGEHEQALVHLKRALPLAPAGLQKRRLQAAIQKLESGTR